MKSLKPIYLGKFSGASTETPTSASDGFNVESLDNISVRFYKNDAEAEIDTGSSTWTWFYSPDFGWTRSNPHQWNATTNFNQLTYNNCFGFLPIPTGITRMHFQAYSGNTDMRYKVMGEKVGYSKPSSRYKA